MESISTDWITLAGIVAVLAFLWKLSSDIAGLRERMASLEGRMLGVELRMSGVEAMLASLFGQHKETPK